jgi:hypothetical protein
MSIVISLLLPYTKLPSFHYANVYIVAVAKMF